MRFTETCAPRLLPSKAADPETFGARSSEEKVAAYREAFATMLSSNSGKVILDWAA